MTKLTKNELVKQNADLAAEVESLRAQLSAAKVQQTVDAKRIVAKTEGAVDLMYWFKKSDAYRHREKATKQAREGKLPYNYGVNKKHGCYTVTRFLKAH